MVLPGHSSTCTCGCVPNRPSLYEASLLRAEARHRSEEEASTHAAAPLTATAESRSKSEDKLSARKLSLDEERLANEKLVSLLLEAARLQARKQESPHAPSPGLDAARADDQHRREFLALPQRSLFESAKLRAKQRAEAQRHMIQQPCSLATQRTGQGFLGAGPLAPL